MPNVLTTASKVECGHTGIVTTASTAKLTVKRSPVLTATSVTGKAISGCLTVPPPQTNKPCTLATALSAGQAVKLTVGSQPVMLDTLAGATDGVSSVRPPALSAAAAQTKLSAN